MRDPLALPAGQLRRVGAGAVAGQLDQVEQPGHLGATLAGRHATARGIASAIESPMRHPGVEGGVRVLEDHLERPAPAAAMARSRLPSSRITAAGDRGQPDRGPGQGRLARAGLADEPDDSCRPAPSGRRRRRPSAGTPPAPNRTETSSNRRSLIGSPLRRGRPRQSGSVPAWSSGASMRPVARRRRRPGLGRPRGTGRRRAGSGRRRRSPSGRWAGSGGRPGMTASGRSRSVAMSGTAASRARV